MEQEAEILRKMRMLILQQLFQEEKLLKNGAVTVLNMPLIKIQLPQP
jgi:hypothetical protein